MPFKIVVTWTNGQNTILLTAVRPNIMTRRDALRLGFTGLGVASALAWRARPAELGAQAPAAVPNPRLNPNFPMMPTWETELKELAPGVYEEPYDERV